LTLIALWGSPKIIHARIILGVSSGLEAHMQNRHPVEGLTDEWVEAEFDALERRPKKGHGCRT
jgi:hypothetical protein